MDCIHLGEELWPRCKCTIHAPLRARSQEFQTIFGCKHDDTIFRVVLLGGRIVEYEIVPGSCQHVPEAKRCKLCQCFRCRWVVVMALVAHTFTKSISCWHLAGDFIRCSTQRFCIQRTRWLVRCLGLFLASFMMLFTSLSRGSRMCVCEAAFWVYA